MLKKGYIHFAQSDALYLWNDKYEPTECVTLFLNKLWLRDARFKSGLVSLTQNGIFNTFAVLYHLWLSNLLCWTAESEHFCKIFSTKSTFIVPYNVLFIWKKLKFYILKFKHLKWHVTHSLYSNKSQTKYENTIEIWCWLM